MPRHDNYPDDIRSYDNDPRSPFHKDPCESCEFDGFCDFTYDSDGYELRCFRLMCDRQELKNAFEECRKIIVEATNSVSVTIECNEDGDVVLYDHDSEYEEKL